MPRKAVVNSKYSHMGYTYAPELEREEHNVKIFHDVYSSDGKQAVGMPMSPYCKVDPLTFTLWVECGRPTREDMGLSHNANCEDVRNYYNKWLDNKIDQEILGVTDE